MKANDGEFGNVAPGVEMWPSCWPCRPLFKPVLTEKQFVPISCKLLLSISENGMATENEEFDEGAFGNDDDGDEVSDEDDVIAIENPLIPFSLDDYDVGSDVVFVAFAVEFVVFVVQFVVFVAVDGNHFSEGK